ncbi:MAG: ABC transporter permease [Bryobacteraceae bacterium]|nr:ABC transporter permease [Bryobacteraceae bacterium]
MTGLSLKHTLRRMARAPLFTAIAVATLAIGIGANTAIFSVVHGVLLKPLPYPEADRLVALWLTAPGVNLPQIDMSPATYFTFREEGRVFDGVGILERGSESVTGIAEPEEVEALYTSETVLPLLQVQPVRGRTFSAADAQPNAPRTAILGFGYWKRRFGGEASALGRNLLLDGRPHEVIGVLPEGFRALGFEPSVVLPMQLNRAETHLGNFSYRGIARLRPGITIEQANADIARMLPLMFEKFPPPQGMNVSAFREARLGPILKSLKDDTVGDVSKLLLVLMATVGIVLLIACANVANLLLVRAEGRQQELAVRAALGASWSDIARELLIESVALGLAGGALGIGAAYGALAYLRRAAPAGLPRIEEIGFDWPVLTFALAISLGTGLFFGLIPVWKYASPRLATALRAGGRTSSESRDRHRTRGALVVAQVALAVVLLVGAGLMMRTMYALANVQPGFSQPERVLTLRLSIPSAQVPDRKRTARMHHDIADKIAAAGGVTSVGLSNSITMDGSRNMDPVFVEGREYRESEIPPIRVFKHLSPGYFATMGNPLIAGRDFTWTDLDGLRPVAIVSENIAREVWGSPEAALGKRIRGNPKGSWREVVGVAGPERDSGVDKPAPGIVYWPFLKEDLYDGNIDVRRTLAYAIRSPRVGSAEFANEVRRAIWSVNPSLPLANVRTVREIYDRSLARTSFTLTMLGIASAMALLLSVIGIYGVIAYSISQRTREIGIRMALGADQRHVRAMFLRDGLSLAGLGAILGIAAAVPLSRLIGTLLYAVNPLDAATYSGVALVLLTAAAIATYIPTRRATRIAPIEALRGD